MKIGQVSYVASIDKASIVVTLLLSFLILKEPVTAKVLTGAGFILIGMVILNLEMTTRFTANRYIFLILYR